MKSLNLIKGTIIVLVLSMSFVCCEKNENARYEETADVLNPKSTPIHLASGDTIYLPITTHRYFYDHGGDDYGCPDGGHGCLDPVIVTPSTYHLIKEKAVMITTENYKPSIAFKDNYDIMVDVFGETLTNCVVKNDLIVNIRGNFDSNGILYFIFINPTTEENVCVVPIGI